MRFCLGVIPKKPPGDIQYIPLDLIECILQQINSLHFCPDITYFTKYVTLRLRPFWQYVF